MRFSGSYLLSTAFAGLVASQGCQVKPVGDNPAGNPIHTPVNQIVPAGTPFTITWTNTTAGNVAINLLRGPSTNVVPIACLVESIPNIGVFVWTPSDSLTPDVTHYGLQIIDTATGQYQYSTQIGISNPGKQSSSSSSVSLISQTSDGQAHAPTGKPQTNPTPVVTSAAPINSINATIVIGTTHIPIPHPSSGLSFSHSIILPTKNMTVPATLKTHKSNTHIPTSTVIKSASATSSSGTGSPIVGPTTSLTPAPNSGAGTILAGRILAGLGAMAAFML